MYSTITLNFTLYVHFIISNFRICKSFMLVFDIKMNFLIISIIINNNLRLSHKTCYQASAAGAVVQSYRIK